MSRSAQRKDAAGQRQRHAGEHEGRIARASRRRRTAGRRSAAARAGTTTARRCDAAMSCSNCPAVVDPVARRQRRPRGAIALAHFGDERAEVAAAHVGGHDDAPLAVLAADLVRPDLESIRCDVGQRHGVRRACDVRHRVEHRGCATSSAASALASVRSRPDRCAGPPAVARRCRSAGRLRTPAPHRCRRRAVANVSCTSATAGRSARAASRSGVTVSIGRPVTCSVCTSALPGTSRRPPVRRARRDPTSVSRSSPKT